MTAAAAAAATTLKKALLGTDRTYIAHDDPRLEPSIPGEAAQTDDVAASINSLQRQNFAKHRHAFRGTHVKTQAVVKGSLVVAEELPEYLRQGLFAHPGTYPVGVRYANEPSLLQDDRAPGPRGCGMRVFNLPEGLKHLHPVGDKTRTQDFTFNNAPALELRDVGTTKEILGLREKYMVEDKETLEQELKKRDDAEVQMAPMQLPNHDFLAYTMYSQSAYRFGKYVCKYALFPTGKLQEGLAEQHKISDSSSPSQHSEWLRDFFAKNDAEYDFRVQLLVDPSSQSVEDTSAEWDEGSYPYETVAKVVLPGGQDVFAAERRTFWEDGMRLNVWWGLEDFRPMGSVNRLRRDVYAASQAFRQEVNARKVVDVDSIDQIP